MKPSESNKTQSLLRNASTPLLISLLTIGLHRGKVRLLVPDTEPLNGFIQVIQPFGLLLLRHSRHQQRPIGAVNRERIRNIYVGIAILDLDLPQVKLAVHFELKRRRWAARTIQKHVIELAETKYQVKSSVYNNNLW